MEFKFKQVRSDDDSLKEICSLLNLTFPNASKFSLEYLRWQYRDNPMGEIVGYNAYDNDLLVAHYVVMPIQMSIYGTTYNGALSLNTATHPQYRGKRLFSILAQKTYQLAIDKGLQFVIGVANANSTHGFLKNLGFDLISPLVTKIGWGDKIYSKVNARCFRVWDEKSLSWRICNPAEKYYLKNNILYGKKVVPLVKVAVGILPLNCTTNLHKSVMRPLTLYVGLGAKISAGSYFNLPAFIKHSPFNLIFRDFTGQIPKLNPKDVFFQLLDFDVI